MKKTGGGAGIRIPYQVIPGWSVPAGGPENIFRPLSTKVMIIMTQSSKMLYLTLGNEQKLSCKFEPGKNTVNGTQKQVRCEIPMKRALCSLQGLWADERREGTVPMMSCFLI